MSTPPAQPPSADAPAPRPRVFNRSDYALIAGSLGNLALLVTLLVLLISAFKQVMSVRWLTRHERRPKVEIRQYVGILAEETRLDRLDRWRRTPGSLPPLYAAMAMAVKGDEGVARLRADMESGAGETRVVAMAGLEYGRPGTLLPLLGSAAEPRRWTEAVRAAALADAYAPVDFAREMDGHFIALFPGKKAIDAAVMNTYQRGLGGLFADADEPDKLAAVRAFHDAQLRAHPELYKPGVIQKIRDAWDACLTRVFEQRRASRAGQEAVRAAAASAAGLTAADWDVVNRFLADRQPGNPVAGVAGSPPAGVAAGEAVLRREGAALRALASSADGRTLASGGFDNRVRVWTSGREADARVCAGHAFGVMAVAVSPDGARVASAGLDGTVRLWNAADGSAAAEVPAGTRRVSALAFSPDGATVAAGGAGGTVRLLGAADGAERRVLRGPAAEVTALAFSPDGSRLIAASLDKTLSVWALQAADSAPKVLDRHTGDVWAMAVAPDGSWMASGAGDRRVLLWSPGDLKRKPRMLKGHKSAVTALAASPDGKLLASAGGDRLVLVWDAARGRLLGAHPTDSVPNALRFEADGRTVLAACDDGTLRRWGVALRDERPFSLGDWALWLTGKE